MAQYIVNTKTFIAPLLIEPGTLINYYGPPGSHLDPDDDEAKAAVEKYYSDNPHARLNPVEALPVYGVEVLAPPVPVPSALDVGILGNPGAAVPMRPGPDDSVSKALAAAKAAATSGGLQPQADDPALGDPRDPGGPGAETKVDTDKANAEAVKAAGGGTSALDALKGQTK